MGDFWVFPAPGQVDFLQQGHLHHWAKNFQKVWYEKNFLKNSEKKIFKIFTLGTFNGALKIIAHVKKSLLQGAEKAKNRP